MSTPLVSIVIPTYNSRFLQVCLNSIKKQSYKNIEVIIVDNYSTDETPEIGVKFGARVIRSRCGRAKAKNLGLKEARGKYVMFIDSDMELSPRVVEECVTLAESDHQVAGVIIPEKSVGRSYWVLVRDFERSFYHHTPIESPRFFVRDLAIRAGGYDEDLVFFEEATLPLKLEELGFNVRARIKSVILHHEESFSLSKWILKKYHYGMTYQKYVKRYRNKSKCSKVVEYQTNPVRRFILLVGNKNFWKNPCLALGVILLKSLEFFAIYLGQTYANI
ncbi:MAG: glycosyltransferase family A protein [Thermofilaceae archaeon]